MSVPTSARSADPDWASGPDGWDPAAAGRASGRRPAAGPASDPGFDSAGPDLGSGSTSGSPLLNVTSVLNATGECNPGKSNWFQANAGSAAVIEWRWPVATVAEGTPS